jgi:CBS domain containing-hemolysin-like protein
VNIAVTIITCVILVAFAGLMAATEAALAVLSVSDVRAMAPSRRARKSLESIARDVRAHRNTTTFIRIAAETTVAVLVTGLLVMTSLELWVALLLAVLIMVAVSFVLAGSSPRSVGRAHPHGVVAVAAPVVHLLRVVLGPLANLLVALGDRVTPGRPGSGTFTSEEQLLSMVDEAVRHDVLEDDERELIHSIFEWNDTVVREVMVPRVDMVTISAGEDLRSAAEIFVASGYSRLPVIGDDADEVLGVLYLRDVARRSMLGQQELDELFARDLLRPALFMPESKKADEALGQMQNEKTHVALVVDEYGGIAGLVTLEDLIEELVGEISDEHDRTQSDVVSLADGSFSVSSRLNTEDLGELFGLELDDDDVDSVGGLMTKQLGRIPQPGDQVTVSGLTLEVFEVDASRGHLTRILVRADDDLLAAHEAFTANESEGE